MRIISMNIRSSRGAWPLRPWILRRRFVYRTLEHWDADVLLLQEVRWRQFRHLSRDLPQYVFAGSGRDDGREKGEMLVAGVHRTSTSVPLRVTPRWFSETPEVPSRFSGQRTPRMALEIEWCGHRFINVHLAESPNPNLEECARMLAQWSKGLAIVAGDFNCLVDEPRLSALSQSDLRDALAHLEPEGVGCATHHSFTGITTGSRIDHVFVPADFRIAGARIDHSEDARRASDHWPVIVDVEPMPPAA